MQQHYDDSLSFGVKSRKANKTLARDLKEAEDIKLINAVRKQRIEIDRVELEGEAEVNFAVDFSTSALKESILKTIYLSKLNQLVQNAGLLKKIVI